MANLAIWRPQERASWLRGFPDSIYDKTPATHLARIMQALCGDPGVGRVRKELMLKRAQTALDATRFSDLDNVYSVLFDFPRLESETYAIAPSELMTWGEWQDAQVKDAHYRRRIRKYMEAFMWGGTRRGVELCVEAACGCDAEAFSADEFYEACGVRDADELYDTVHGLQDGIQVGVEPTDDMEGVSYADDAEAKGGRVADFSEYVVVAMRDDPVSAEELLLAHRALSRVAPDHARAVVMSRMELSSKMVLEGCDEVSVPIRGVQASSSWWNVTRTVTGRMDWEYRKYPHLWVKPGVPVEAPRQALVLSQEESFDMTPTAVSAKASTCHEGRYNRLMSRLFSDITATTQETEPMCAVSRSSNRRYTASFYGGTDVVDWSYPVEYIPELDRRFSEIARSSRWWSSEEARSGTEYVEVYLKRSVPLNRISLSVSQKPVRVVPYYSSGTSDGERVWRRARSSDGSPMAHSVRSWGGSSVGSSFVGIDFETQLVEADAVRIEFERLDVPYTETGSDGSRTEQRPAYSVDVRDMSVRWDVLSRQDVRDAVFEDPFGNRVETGVRDMLPEGMLDGDPETYWCSQPNVSPNAVEWLVLDVRDDDGCPQRVGFLDIEAVYEGARMNAYSSDDAETWVPYPEPFELRSGRIDLPDRRTSFIKLEFTNLCGLPYCPVAEGIRVKTLEFPPSEVSYAASLKTESSAMSRTEMLLTSPDDLSYDNAGVYDVLGAPDIYSRKDSPLQGAQRKSAFLFTSDAYRSREWSQVSGAYGDDMAIESGMNVSYRNVPTASLDGSYLRLMFHEAGPHRYRVNWHERKYDAAFVVGIKSVRAGYGGQNLHARPGEPFVVQMGDSNMVGDVNQWELVDGERMVPSTSKALCTLQTQDLQTVVPFRAFDFATNQRQPDQVFAHPSDMSREWHEIIPTKAYRDEFGVSGTVLHAERGADGFGVRSDGKLVCANGVARFEAEVFPSQVGDDVETSHWTVECRDQFGEQVYSMTYSCESGQWTKMGCVFTPQPGSGWWDLSYSYRMRVPLVGPVEAGSHVFVPFFDVDAMRRLDGVRDDLADLRLVRHSGTETSEIPYDMTDNMELWFRCPQALEAGQQANGYFERSTGRFTDAYYVYFGNPGETSATKDDWEDVFDHIVEAEGDAEFGDGGALLSVGGLRCDGVPIPKGGGFVSMWLELADDLVEVRDGARGTADERCLLDMEGEDGTEVSAYLFERQLVLSVREPDGFESSAVTADGELERAGLVRGARRLVLLTWGAQGSAPTYVGGMPDPSSARRRRCEIRVGSLEPLRLVQNVYDEKDYSRGTY